MRADPVNQEVKRLQPSDFEQAVRYIQSALKRLDREAPPTRAVRQLFDRIIRQLSPGDYFMGMMGVAADVSLLREMAANVPAAPRVDLLKAIAVLRDRS
jgi:hypothetical protein